MIYLFKPLPSNTMDFSEWKPYIKNAWFLKHFRKFTYGLEAILVLLSMRLNVWGFANWFVKIIVFIAVFLIHELLHVLVVCKIGDVSVTYSKGSIWVTSNAIMSKNRYWLFITLPLIVLTIVPGFFAFIIGFAFETLKYIAWINAIIASADIINSIWIAIQPSNAKFCKGYCIADKQ